MVCVCVFAGYLGRKQPSMGDLKFVKRTLKAKSECFRLLDRIQSHWRVIGEALGIEHYTLDSIKKKNDEDSERIAAVFVIWIENARELPHSKDYPLSWQGLRTLLYDVDLAERAIQYFEFLQSIPQSQW